MKNYTITVNGNVYDVTVEEKGAGAVSAAPVAAPVAAPAAAPVAAAPKASAGAGSIQVKAGAAGISGALIFGYIASLIVNPKMKK